MREGKHVIILGSRLKKINLDLFEIDELYYFDEERADFHFLAAVESFEDHGSIVRRHQVQETTRQN